MLTASGEIDDKRFSDEIQFWQTTAIQVIKARAARARQVFQNASAALDKCAMNASCYVQLLDEPIPDVNNGNWKAMKAAHMAGMLGNDQTRRDLVARVAKVTNPGARLAIVMAINHLAPKGDAATADALEKIVADDKVRNDGAALRGDDALTKVALMLRARVSP
jgi:enamine deaminase RidA (YjgF/YER057c/UK114 family)